jgi:glycosyltransferase involved in cell wall biosynthesis
MRLLVDARWIGDHGIGRFAREVLTRLPNATWLTGGPRPFSPGDLIWLTLAIGRERPDIFFSPGPNVPPWIVAPYVLTLHDLIPLQFPGRRRLAKRVYFAGLVRTAVRRARCVLTVSAFSKREILEWAGVPDERIRIVGNGVSPRFCPDGPRKDLGAPFLLYVGSYKAHKNLPRVIRAFGVSKLTRDVLLVLSGTGDHALRRIVEKLGLEARVRFAGPIPEDELPTWYRGATALILASLTEGFGLPAVEAMACGTPVLTSRAGALPETVGDAGVYVDPHDVESIAAGMERIVFDETLRGELRQRGLARAREFSWDRTAAEVMTALNEFG